MSGCGCTGHYHSSACSDQNVLFWDPGRAPVSPTQDEIEQQKKRNFARLPPEQQRKVIVDQTLGHKPVPLRPFGWPETDSAADHKPSWPA